MKKNNNNLLLIIIISFILLITIFLIIKLKDKYVTTKNVLKGPELPKFPELKICGNGNEDDTYNINKCVSLKSNSNSNKLKAINLSGSIWTKKEISNSTITIFFMNKPPDNFKNTFENCIFDENENIKDFPADFPFLEGVGKDSYEGVKFDPLENVLKNNKNIKENIIRILNERYTPITGIYFKEYTFEDYQISILFDPSKGCWSHIGKHSLENPSPTSPTMNFGWFDVGTVLHEFGHVLGLLHEHQSPYKIPFFDKINWNLPKLYDWAKTTQGWDVEKTKKEIIVPLSIFSTRGTWYDPESIMLYFFPGILTKDGKGTSQNRR
jgi:hypothetical protein